MRQKHYEYDAWNITDLGDQWLESFARHSPAKALRHYNDQELRDYLFDDAFTLHWTEDGNHLEVFECHGGVFTTVPFDERSTGNIFSSVQEAFKWVYNL